MLSEDQLKAIERDYTPRGRNDGVEDSERILPLIAELRATRKVVEAARHAVNWMQRGSADYVGLHPLEATLSALAELSSINVRSDDLGNQPQKNFSELGNDPSLRSESESAT